MAGQLVVRELSIVVVGRNHNPSILNPDFLKYNGIVPGDWELAQPPLCTEMVSQVVFKNGVATLSQQDKIIFTEMFGPDGSGTTEAPEIARRYLENVPHVTYQAVGVNPKGHVEFDSERAALGCLRDTFLAKGTWLEFGKGLHQAGVKFTYELENRTLNLTVETGTIGAGPDSTAVIVFGANFHHELGGDTTKERLESGLDEMAKWEADVEDFRNLVERHIFGGEILCN